MNEPSTYAELAAMMGHESPQQYQKRMDDLFAKFESGEISREELRIAIGFDTVKNKSTQETP